MFFRVTNFEYPEDQRDEIEAWVHTKTEQVRAIGGLVAVDVFEAMPGEGVIVASYDNEGAFDSAQATVGAILAELAQYLKGAPVTLSGNAFWTTRA